MRKLILALAALAVVGIAAPAANADAIVIKHHRHHDWHHHHAKVIIKHDHD